MKNNNYFTQKLPIIIPTINLSHLLTFTLRSSPFEEIPPSLHPPNSPNRLTRKDRKIEEVRKTTQE